jgi:general secretion pathway protein H
MIDPAPLIRGAAEEAGSAENGFESSLRSAENGFTFFSRSAEHGFTSSSRSAEHGFTFFSRSAEHGFTLTELMVVIALIGLATAAVVITLPGRNADVQREASRFAARAASLRDRAVVEGHSYGLWVTSSGYGFERRSAGQWQPLTDGRLSRADWPAGTAVSVDGGTQGRLSFDRIGMPDEVMHIDFTAGDARATVDIGAAGEVSVR